MAILVGSSCQSSFEHQRTVVVDYLRAYNEIDNDLDETLDAVISSPVVYTVLPQLLTAYQGGLKRTNELKPPTEEIVEHHQSFVQFLERNITAIQNLQAAILLENQTAITKAFDELEFAQSQASPMNRITEDLMVKYNIPDSEVNYRFRGK